MALWERIANVDGFDKDIGPACVGRRIAQTRNLQIQYIAGALARQPRPRQEGYPLSDHRQALEVDQGRPAADSTQRIHLYRSNPRSPQKGR